MPRSQSLQNEPTHHPNAHDPQEQVDDTQPPLSPSTPLTDWFNKVPNLALLAASFVAADPFIPPLVMGGKH